MICLHSILCSAVHHLNVRSKPPSPAGDLQQFQPCAGLHAGALQVASQRHKGAALHRVLTAQEQRLRGAFVDLRAVRREPAVRLCPATATSFSALDQDLLTSAQDLESDEGLKNDSTECNGPCLQWPLPMNGFGTGWSAGARHSMTPCHSFARYSRCYLDGGRQQVSGRLMQLG